MATPELTLEDLRRILRTVAGEAEGTGLDGDILDVTFTDLGYDSLALLETAGQIERERELQLDESTITEAQTPRELLAAVTEQLAAA
jgi:act minimal PKS acyl carrier protein